ncbi:hypothetical protein SAMN05443428_1187 [Caloramator quimbayensis]|uniref:Lipoprotein n=1 Tax=Caloramator quimbayensis TaxID=1147123 RepID=A0A1T4Y1H7_9CLOT|nr:hypothetical protein [Caloramator quimbayensis]SKA95328.1 hypothetical protein SAMN05443428_1187 [Caloramator quimbayensis]
MKKWFCMFLIIILIFTTGCPGNEKKKSNESNKVEVNKSENKIDKNAASAFINNYLAYVLKGDFDGMKSFYNDEVKSQIKSIPVSSSSRPVGYKIDTDDSGLEESQNEGKSAAFKVHLFNSGQDIPYFSDDLYKYTVELKNNKMVISKIEKEKSTEIYEKNKVLYKREGDKIKGEKILSLSEMPDFISLSNTLYPGQKIPLPKDGFGPCAISPDGKNILITTKGTLKTAGASGGSIKNDVTYAFIAILSMKEDEQQSIQQNKNTKDSKQVIKLEGGGDEKNKEESSGNEESKTGAEGQEKEKVQLPSIKTLDLYVEAKIKTAAFSPDGKFIIVEYIPPSGLNRIKMYKVQEREIVELIVDRQFLPDRFGIVSPAFISFEELSFKVVPSKDATSEEQKYEGIWKMDIKEQKLKPF